MTAPTTLADIRNKVRRITARPSVNQISNAQIDEYINTYYLYDMPAQLKMESFRVNYQFVTQPNVNVYNFPTNLYLEAMPPVYIAGYQCYMSQSRENFLRFNPRINFNQQDVATGTGGVGPYTGTITATPIMRGWNTNPASTNISEINWAVLFSGPVTVAGVTTMTTLVDDGQGNLFDLSDTTSSAPRGTIDYATGVFSATFLNPVDLGGSINVQYVPYVASRPNSVLFYQDQIQLYPIPDQAYTVSFEAYKLPTAFDSGLPGASPQLKELWQLLAYGAADKIFADNADIENMMKFRPLLEEQLKFCLRRTINQYSSERTATIYTEQTGLTQYPFNNVYSGF